MIRRPLTILASLVASCAILTAQGAGAPPPQDQRPTFRLRVDSVSVDVTVTDKQGRPVTDLKEADFEIREAGKVQAIENFRLIQIDEVDATGPERPSQILSSSDMSRETANPENRLFIIFLDDYHTRVGNSLHIRQHLAQFVSRLTPRDLVALLYPINSVASATFSRDHEGTAAAIMQFQGRKYIYNKLRSPYEQSFANQPPEVQEQIRNDITINTLKSTCALMSTLREGRKTILMVSEGLVANIPPGALTQGSGFPRPTNLTPAQAQQQAQAMMSREFFNTADLTGRMRDIFTLCSRGNSSIYTLDPRGLAAGEFGAGDRVDPDADRRAMNDAIDTLRVLADQTGGRAIVGSNDPIPDLKKMLQELSAYYLLGYTSSVAPRDGKFHEIQVRVNRRDVEVHARKGYWAYTEDEIKRATAPPKPGPPEAVAEALDTLVGVVEPTSRHTVGVWIGATRGDTEKAQVTLVWEGMPANPDTPANRVEQVSLIATSGSDEVFRGPVPRDANAFVPSGRVTFAAPAGPLRVKVAVENARGQRLDNEDISELVPDFTSTGATITAPQVFRARTAFEINTLRKSTTTLPAVTRQFSRSERLLLRFEAYGPAGTKPQVTMRLLNRMGELLPGITLVPTSAAGNTFEADLGLSSLQAGDYLIEIAAVAGDDRSVTLLGIRVTG